MGAIVRAFDVRPVTKEQVESMGATFLEVPIKEDGSGSGGYAKEMSDTFKEAQNQMMLEQAKDVDIIITTALIPGRKAPVLVDKDMLSAMKPGSVCVDLAAANGGNVAQTKANEVVTTDNGVKIVGYTNLPSRLAATASNLVRVILSPITYSSFYVNKYLCFWNPSVWEQCRQIYHQYWTADHEGKR
jgi:NAD/NADP transhydrogenase alpha subunit